MHYAKFFFSSRRRHTRLQGDWSSDVCSSDLTFVNTERRIQLARKAAATPGQARGDLEILIDLSNRLGLTTRFETAEAVMREIARVTPSWRGVTYQRLRRAGREVPRAHGGSPGNPVYLRAP